MLLYYLILWNQVDILQKHFKKDHVPYEPLDEALRYERWWHSLLSSDSSSSLSLSHWTNDSLATCSSMASLVASQSVAISLSCNMACSMADFSDMCRASRIRVLSASWKQTRKISLIMDVARKIRTVYLSPNFFFWYVKGTHFRSPLHQHSVKNIHQVMKKCISKFRVWEGDYQISAQIVPIIPANKAGVV